ncbi:hypothetical protein AKJ16_DCAP19840 [Drosera capensis]
MADEETQQIKPIEIDHIPNIVQQPRSSSAKRRIDLSLFACSHSSQSDLSPESTVSKDASTVTLASADCPKGAPRFLLVPCSNGENEVEAMSSEDSVYQVTESVSYPGDSLAGQSTSSNEEKGYDDQKLRLIPDNLDLAECQPSCCTPASQTTENQSSSEQCADVQGKDLNSFDVHEASGSRRRRSRSASTSKVESHNEETGRGKRKRKPRALFDMKPTSIKSPTKKPRRVKIMRLLGLTAPVGSPFMFPS